ncbi:DsbA family protein [Yoonia sp. R2331]|uniref:DsbA family protein n=1 Tax=Yoonia sp. R2331 TaxID=3237238 RepID=UPI0034E5173F
MDRRLFIGGGAVAVGLGAAWVVQNGRGAGQPSELLVGMANAQEASADTSMITDMVLGDENAAVEVIEYASYTCPHCASFHAGAFKQLKSDYIDTGKIKFVYREVYFDRFGLWASMIARCGGDTNRFFGISDMIYEKQREWTASGDPAQIVEELKKIGKIAGLDDATLDACMQDADMAQSLVTWFQENQERDGINSTPSFVIDGTKYSNMSYADFSALLDDKIAG